jgi:hypothetical protein
MNPDYFEKWNIDSDDIASYWHVSDKLAHLIRTNGIDSDAVKFLDFYRGKKRIYFHNRTEVASFFKMHSVPERFIKEPIFYFLINIGITKSDLKRLVNKENIFNIYPESLMF